MKEFLGEVAKLAYLNKTNGYNMDYVLNEYSFSSSSKALTGTQLKSFKDNWFKN
ncbi:hypothetical protein [Spiroplasma taiwanense]|uniref:Uncharacterized protein n=1 Tax=Spiroplasma taiwanense CT-1 TaxID=1276220 RepID=S5LUD9_9MOLU|nr:hypothetical protein [Spiroplasma taiwanense]AGR41399.1 hypothetical protein STAIW_v1c08110 [Spiroplasma taiwanense CT-1]